MKTLSSEEKEKLWGYGPWVKEPDFYEFKHNGIKCEIIRNIREYDGSPELFGGHFCGYCYLPDGHPFIGLSYQDVVPGIEPDLNQKVELDKFGISGLFSLAMGDEHHLKEWLCTIEGLIKVHGGVTYLEGNKIGFDCAHSGDYSPASEAYYAKTKNAYEKEIFNSLHERNVYRDLEYVIDECKSMADQILKYRNK